MIKKLVGVLKLLLFIALIGAGVWFLYLSPRYTFKNYEKNVESAARRYFELNSDQLPTGERTKTVSLGELFSGAYIKEDFRAPYSLDNCSYDDSWVKVKRVNGKYKYYIYLDCGVLQSDVDHTGPEIKLNGESNMTIEIGSKYEEPGVMTVKDDKDGNIDVSRVRITGEVDSSKVGKYEITYSVIDSLKNKTVVTRNVNVIKTFRKTVKNILNGKSNFVGDPENNYVLLSNILFRIYGIDKNNNIVLIADENVSYASYSKLKEWTDYFYNSITDESKKLLVKSKFCNMQVAFDDRNTTECNSYTDERYVYVPSVVEINKSYDPNIETSFVIPLIMSWLSNPLDGNTAYALRRFSNNENGVHTNYYKENVDCNYGIRPMVVIKGSSNLKGGDGTRGNPYYFSDKKSVKGGESLSNAQVGQYISFRETLWRIAENKNGKLKVIATGTLKYSNGYYIDYVTTNFSEKNVIYNPKDKKNFAYYINNKTSDYFDSSLFELHDFEVPLYNKKVLYGTEVSKNTYKLKYAAPNMFDMFSISENLYDTYFFINSSKQKGLITVVYGLGIPNDVPVPDDWKIGIKISGYIKDGYVVTSGDGTILSPYKIK